MAGLNATHELDEEKPLDPAAERVRRKLLRFMIVNLAILFAAVMAVVLAFVYKSVRSEDDPVVESDAGTPAGEPLSGEIHLPAGSQIISHSASGNRLILHLRLENGSDAILLYDISQGRPIGEFQLVEEAR